MSTLNVRTIQHESGAGNNIVLDSDGNVEIADGNIKTGAGVKTTGAAGAQVNANGLIASSRTTGKSSTEEAFYVQVAADDSTAKEKVITMFTDGRINAARTYTNIDTNSSAFRVNDTTTDKQTFDITGSGQVSIGADLAVSSKISLKPDGTSTFKGRLTADITRDNAIIAYVRGDTNTSTCVYARNFATSYSTATNFKGLNANGNATFEVFADGTIDAKNVTFNLNPEDPDSWKVTQEEYQEDVTGPLGKLEKTVTKTREVREYIGETLSVRDELQALRARATQQDAVIAQMVTALRSQGVTIDTTEVKE